MPTEERKIMFVYDNVALPSEPGFAPHQATCNYHVETSGAHSNQAAA
jgi:hypothetical protein